MSTLAESYVAAAARGRDVVTGGPIDTVASDVARIAKEGGEMSLHLNAAKFELIAHQGKYWYMRFILSVLNLIIINTMYYKMLI